MSEVPTKEDWGEYWLDFDQESAFEAYHAKTNEQMKILYRRAGNQLITYLRFMPKIPFRYYMKGMCEFILEGEFARYDAADMTSYLLDMVEYIIDEKVEFIAADMEDIMPTLKYIAENQEKFDASILVYGSFSDKLESIVALAARKEISF